MRARDDEVLALSAAQILHAYIAIHNDVFAASFFAALRRMLPIPGLFQRIPFDQHAASLGDMVMKIDQLRTIAESQLAAASYGRRGEFLNSYVAYTRALGETLGSFQNICVRLHGRGDSPASYSMDEYNADFAEYERVRQTYMSLGTPLNATYRALEA